MNERHALLALLLPLLFVDTTLAQQVDWPGFRGPNHDGVARDGKPPIKWSDKENLAWKLQLPGPGSSSPIVVGDKIFVTCYDGYGQHLDDGGDPKKLEHHLVCVARDTGKVVWDKTVPGPLTKKARRIQVSQHGFASPTPVSDGKAIYAYFGDAGVVAFDLKGEKLWQSDLGRPSPDAPTATNAVRQRGQRISLRWGSAASPILHDGMVILNASEQCNSVCAFDQKTGKLLWKRESANMEGCAITPIIAGKGEAAVVVQTIAGEVWGLAPKTGEFRWIVETGTRTGMGPTPVADEELVYTFGGSGKSFALRFAGQDSKEVLLAVAERRKDAKIVDAEGLDEKNPVVPDNPRIAWSGANIGVPSPTLYEGKLFLVDMKGSAVWLKASDGKQLHKGRLEGRTSGIYASPTAADGRLYVVSRKRGTFVYSADEKLELLARNELDDNSQFHGSAAVVGKQLFLRSDKFLYCIAGGD